MLKFNATFCWVLHLLSNKQTKSMKILVIITILIIVNLILLAFSVNKKTEP